MRMIFLVRGNMRLGMSTHDSSGNIKQVKSPSFEEDPAGGCIAVGILNSDTMEQEGEAECFGDYDHAGILKAVISKLGDGRPGNLPDFHKIFYEAGMNGDTEIFCQYCRGMNCGDCIVKEWMEEL